MSSVFRPTSVLYKGKTATSSRTWLARHFDDPYVRKRLSDPRSYRSRSAFKLLEMDNNHTSFLRQRDVKAVVDLGAAPGGWSQVVAGYMGYGATTPDVGPRGNETLFGADRVRLEGRWGLKMKADSEHIEANDGWSMDGDSWSTTPLVGDGDTDGNTDERGVVIAVDRLHMQPIEGVHTLQMDFLSPEAGQLVHTLLQAKANSEGKADIIMSDMAANMSGNSTRDSAACLDICHAVWKFTRQHLRTADSIGRARGGVLLLKHFAHPRMVSFREKCLDPNFKSVLYVKPDSSRSASAEGYWLCRGYRPSPNILEDPPIED